MEKPFKGALFQGTGKVDEKRRVGEEAKNRLARNLK
jgi:hypothetical protein